MSHTMAILVTAFSLAVLAPAGTAAGQRPASEGASAAVQDNGPRLMEAYHLGPGDQLRVELYGEPQLSQSLQVRPDGKITMPLVGELVAAGMTPLDLRDNLTEAYREYISNPVVTVIVVEANAAVAYVMGEVENPGPLPLNGPVTVLQALAMAGGFKDFANTRNIRVLRQGPNGQQIIRFNYRDAARGVGDPVYLQPGDTVIVP
jgi:polysaccharide biosynthesis/export protein